MIGAASNSFFPETRWTVIQRMGNGRREIQMCGWDEFTVIYSPVLVNWLKARGLSMVLAEDLVQGFLLKLWKKSDLSESLSADQGKLRNFLLVGLRNWWRDHHSRESRQKRGGEAIPDELSGNEAVGPLELDVYDREWAEATIRLACLKLKAEYQARGKMELFTAGLKLIDSPDVGERERLQQSLGMQANSLTVALKRLRERLALRLREYVTATLVDPTDEDVNLELRYLLAALEAGGGLSKVTNSLS